MTYRNHLRVWRSVWISSAIFSSVLVFLAHHYRSAKLNLVWLHVPGFFQRAIFVVGASMCVNKAKHVGLRHVKISFAFFFPRRKKYLNLKTIRICCDGFFERKVSERNEQNIFLI